MQKITYEQCEGACPEFRRMIAEASHQGGTDKYADGAVLASVARISRR